MKNHKSISNRKRSIYSNEKIDANYRCNNIEDVNCQNYSKFQESIKGDFIKKSAPKTTKEIIKSGYNISNFDINSIGSAVGLTCSTTPIVRPRKCLEKDELTLAQDFQIYLKAFALIYVLPEEEWTSENIDKLLLDGNEFFQVSSEDHADGPLHQKSNSNLENSIKRKFKLDGYSFTLELKPPYLGEEKIPLENRPPHIISNLKSVLQGFFRTAHYCLLLYKAGYLLIWRRRKVYFVMDVKGRRREDLISVKNGVAMLICLKNLNNLVHLVSNLSGVSPSDKFSIRELAVVSLVTAEGRLFLRESNHRPVEYNVIDQKYAYLTSHLHLSLNPDAILRNRSSLIVGVAAILASKIDHPASWNTNMFDRLICYGVEFYRNWSLNVKNDLSMELKNFPKQLRLGQFIVNLNLDTNVSTGQWIYSDMSSTVNNNFEKDLLPTLQTHGNAVFQINNQTYALWIKDKFYYLLDPYRHTVSNPQKLKDGTQSVKWATVRMFRDSPTMFSVFHKLLKESNRQSKYSIHVVHIKKIVECNKGYIPNQLPEDDNYDVKSLNETIEFSEKFNNLQKFLSEFSDYEPDLPSETEEETIVVNKFKLAVDKDEIKEKIEEVIFIKSKTMLSKPKTPKNSRTRAASRSTSPIGKKLNSIINFKTVSRHSPVKTKSPKLSLTNIKLENVQNQHSILEPTNSIPNYLSARRKGVWPAKATDNLSALLKETRFNQTGIIASSGFTNKLNKRKKTDNSQTSFQTARLPPDISYPIYTKYPHNLAVVGSESGTVESLKRLLKSAFKVSNRVLAITPWGNYVIFKHPNQWEKSPLYYLFDGCTCNIDRFRHLDLRFGTAGLLPFETKAHVICYMIDSRQTRASKSLFTTLEATHRCLEEFVGRGT